MITQTELIDTLEHFSSIIECNKGHLNIESFNDRGYFIRHSYKQYIENLLCFFLNRNDCGCHRIAHSKSRNKNFIAFFNEVLIKRVF